MRISVTEPSSVILSQTKTFKKMKSDAPILKVPKQAKAKSEGVNKTNKLQYQSILTRKIFMLSKRNESSEIDHRTLLKSSICENLKRATFLVMSEA